MKTHKYLDLKAEKRLIYLIPKPLQLWNGELWYSEICTAEFKINAITFANNVIADIIHDIWSTI